MILAGKAAEPVLVVSVLYASVKLLPIVHFAPQFDVAVFIAQFMALDIGGLSLNKLADQAKKDGNEEGAKQAKRLSIALVSVMLVGVIMAGVDQVIPLHGQVGTVIDTILLIARAVMAVLYSRVIHSLRDEEFGMPAAYYREDGNTLIAEAVTAALAEAMVAMRQEVGSQLEANLSQRLDERLTMLDMKQADAMAHLKIEQAIMVSETVTSMVETALQKRRSVPRTTRETNHAPPVPVASSKVRSISEAASRQRPVGGSAAQQEIDKVIWPLLNSGLSVRAIAVQANTSTATVGRSRKRWDAANKCVSTLHSETPNRSADGETEERAW